MDVQDIDKFENKYNLNICLFEISKKKMVRAHIAKSKIKEKTVRHLINVFYFDNHYAVIKDLSRSFASQITKMGIKFVYIHSV